MITKQRIGTAYDNDGKMLDSYDWRGLSTDTKPTTNVAVNDLFLEVDTGNCYYFNGTAWALVG